MLSNIQGYSWQFHKNDCIPAKIPSSFQMEVLGVWVIQASGKLKLQYQAPRANDLMSPECMVTGARASWTCTFLSAKLFFKYPPVLQCWCHSIIKAYMQIIVQLSINVIIHKPSVLWYTVPSSIVILGQWKRCRAYNSRSSLCIWSTSQQKLTSRANASTFLTRTPPSCPKSVHWFDHDTSLWCSIRI